MIFLPTYPQFLFYNLININLLMRYFALSFYWTFETWYVIYNYSISQLGLATLQELNSHMWLVAVMADSRSMWYLDKKIWEWKVLLLATSVKHSFALMTFGGKKETVINTVIKTQQHIMPFSKILMSYLHLKLSLLLTDMSWTTKKAECWRTDAFEQWC